MLLVITIIKSQKACGILFKTIKMASVSRVNEVNVNDTEFLFLFCFGDFWPPYIIFKEHLLQIQLESRKHSYSYFLYIFFYFFYCPRIVVLFHAWSPTGLFWTWQICLRGFCAPQTWNYVQHILRVDSLATPRTIQDNHFKAFYLSNLRVLLFWFSFFFLTLHNIFSWIFF